SSTEGTKLTGNTRTSLWPIFRIGRDSKNLADRGVAMPTIGLFDQRLDVHGPDTELRIALQWPACTTIRTQGRRLNNCLDELAYAILLTLCCQDQSVVEHATVHAREVNVAVVLGQEGTNVGA